MAMIDGVDDEAVMRMFDGLTGRQQGRANTNAKMAAGREVRKAIVRHINFEDSPAPKKDPKRTAPGALRRSLKSRKAVKEAKYGNVYVAAGVKVGDEDAYYAKWVDQGHGVKKRNIGKRGGARLTKGKFFLEAGARAATDAAITAYRKRFWKYIEDEMDKSKSRSR